MSVPTLQKPTLLVLASTYPRWTGDPEPGFVHELAKRLLNRFRVIVLCPHAEGAQVREVMDGVDVRRYRYCPGRLETLVNHGGIVTNLRNDPWKWLLVPGFFLVQTLEAARICRRERVDVVHAHWLIPQGLVAALISNLPGRSIPYLVTSHGADLYALRGRVAELIKRWVLRRAGAVSVVSRAMRNVVMQSEPSLAEVSVIPMGVDMQKRFVQTVGEPRSKSELLFVGRLVEKKGVRHLIDALPAILRHVPDASLTIVGFGPDEANLKAQVVALGLGNAVSFLGALPQTELPQIYRRAALFVAPFVRAESGDQEGLPVALMEAVGCGCPVVVGDIDGIEDLIGDMKSQICVDVRDTDVLAAKVIEMLSSPEVARERAQRTFAVAAEHVDWSCVAERYGQLLGSMVDVPQ